MSSNESLLAPKERVLSTLNPDGSRRWLKPRPSPGTFRLARRIVAYVLIVIYSALPWMTINGKPAILLDVVQRRFTFFGKTFLPTDTLLLALLLIIVFIAIFLITALFGRVWCGWACPQTVYLEFIYRPIEFLLEGAPGKKKPRKFVGLRKVLRIVIYLVISLHLAQTFIAYFVGAENVADWIWGAPTDHPVAFTIVAVITGLMMFDFTYFREQVCCVVCPYARMQSALLDKDSLIVTYDKNRGEPRGKKKRVKEAEATGDIALPQLGDCIDCTMCVQTCPTGIDIREGLQLECIGCAQCIDACNTVMEKIGRAPNLIKYSSERIIEGGKTHIIRPRIIIYPIILILLTGAFIYLLNTKAAADVLLIREQRSPFVFVPETEEVRNQVRIRITNRTDAPQSYNAQVVSPEGARILGLESLSLDASEQGSRQFQIVAPFSTFSGGEVDAQVRVTDEAGEFEQVLPFKLLGPMSRPKNTSGEVSP
ncbi:MAG: cytochrome c oxidase accessory protein CcoG [bacterium]|nr:cytochrome c oxidase accessory protein CcoG [bacterium]